ncbi:MAG: hypothetical protein KAZ30_01530, partial [Candidatus Magasanikbacteria bacterium]|nr:hypothetical protein [Candidatus Magasanikbacteria bacterium]
MSFYEKIRLNFPLYFTLSLIFSVAIWSLWAPNWFEDVNNSLAAPITSFSTPVNTSPQVPSGADVKLAYYNGTYAIAFASSSVTATSATTTCAYPGSNPGPQACKLFFTKSYDGGVTWSSPTLVSSNLAFHTDRAVISSLSYDERRGVWVILYKEHGGTGDIVQAYSSNGSTWTVNTVISDNSNSSAHYLGKTAAIAFSTSSDLRAVLAQRGHDLVVGTTTNTGLTTSWPTSSIVSFKGSIDTNSNSYEGAIRPMGISIDGANNIHVVYA